MARSVFGRLRSEGERIALPNECEENDRAVRYLARATGVGHYDNINLLIMAVLFIFVSVAFLAVNGGKAGSNRSEPVTKDSIMSGNFTSNLEKSYLDQLPIPDEIKRANEVVSLLYGFGNKLSDPKRKNYSSNSNNSGASQNAFERDEKDHNEHAVTMGTQTDENGNIMTTVEVVKTAPGGGTTAVARTDMSMNSSAAVSTQPGETTTTNNEAPVVTTTTTTTARHAHSETQTSASSAAESSVSTSEPADSSEPDISSDSSEPDITEPDITEPDDDSQPDITEPIGGDDPVI